MNYIGIRGHRGAGKTTIAYLLGCTLDYMKSRSFNDDPILYKQKFIEWCEDIKSDPQCLNRVALTHVIFEEFGDTPKMVLSMITGIPLADMDNQYKKDHIIIDLRDFTTQMLDDEEIENLSSHDKIWTAVEYFDNIKYSKSPAAIREHTYMCLRELIVYFGVYVMQNALGLNVWIKSMQANHKFFTALFDDDQNNFKIFSDIKASSEITFLKEHNGIIINVSRPNNKKKGGMNLLVGDSRYDFSMTIDCELEDLWNEVYVLATQIINKLNGNDSI